MAVEAPHMNLFPSQFLTNSEIIKHNNNNLSNAAELLSYNGQMDSTVIPLPLPLPLPLPVPSSATMAEPLLPFYPSAVCDLASAKTSMNKSVDSGLTCHNIPPTRKRPRDLIAESIPHAAKINKFSSESSSSSSFLDQDILYQIQNQQSEIDLFISQYTEKLRMELEKQRVRQSRTLLSGIQEAMVKKLKEKDEEIQRMGKMNWMLQERAKSLCVENQIWRDLAQTNEATANSLRSNLEQVLAHVADDHLHTSAGAGAGPEDVPEVWGERGDSAIAAM
ncbi:BOI-related E3 ubiquitin-protein ligase 1-like [Senna tora]|uniref:BOI-related E3 ubiquitin-protein ligase 1-like n=1 Tax=Senna tora TaxID=362788 RepID=A0A834XDI3_9FABA|nr:BOI-related E3 ubiquitin-protein ligase 1-like [Senna tora]